MTTYTHREMSINPISSFKGLVFFIVLTLLCLLYITPIILSDRLYIDDILRSQLGYTNWSINGRPLADIIMTAFNLNGDNIVDLSPLPLIASSMIFCYFSYLYSKDNMSEFSPGIAALVCFCIFSNPFMLENLSYKFDVLPMTLSISILMLAFLRFKWKFSVNIISPACIIASLSLYQASIGFFIILSLCEFINDFKKQGENISFNPIIKLIIRSVHFLIAYFIYVCISEDLISGDYNEEHSQIIQLNSHGFNSFIQNVISIFYKIKTYSHEVGYVISFITLGVILHLLKIIIKNKPKDALNLSYILSSLVVFTTPVLIVLFSFIHLCVLQSPIIADRVLISFGGVIFFFIWSYLSLTKFKKTQLLLIMPFLLFSFIYSYSYGSAMKHQKNFDVMLSSEIAENISLLDPSAEKNVIFFGTQPSSKQRDNAIVRFPSLQSLVPIYYTGGWWGTQLIKMYGVRNKIEGAKSLSEACIMKKEFENQIYSIFTNKESIMITFEKPACH